MHNYILKLYIKICLISTCWLILIHINTYTHTCPHMISKECEMLRFIHGLYVFLLFLYFTHLNTSLRKIMMRSMLLTFSKLQLIMLCLNIFLKKWQYSKCFFQKISYTPFSCINSIVPLDARMCRPLDSEIIAS